MSLHEKTMLVSLTIKSWSANKKDIKATREVHENHNAKEAGVFRKYLIDPKALKNITQVANEARTFHYEHTLPWGDKGYRILTTEAKPDYDRKIRIFHDDYQFQVETFLKKYPQEIENARQKLNGLFNETEYPETDKLRARFYFRTQVMPVPHGNDFRINLAKEDMTAIRAELNSQLEEITRNAQRDLWLRLHEAIKLVSEALKNPKRRWVKNTFQKFEDRDHRSIKFQWRPQIDRTRQQSQGRVCSPRPRSLQEKHKRQRSSGQGS